MIRSWAACSFTLHSALCCDVRALLSGGRFRIRCMWPMCETHDAGRAACARDLIGPHWTRVVSQGSEARFQRASPSLLFACARLSDESAHPCARHPIAQGCRASPARSRPARMAIRRAIATASTSKHRPTWHLASSRCCAGNGPEFLATMAAVMKMSLRRARWLVLCRRACVALDALLKTPRLCPLVRVSVRTMRLLLIAR